MTRGPIYKYRLELGHSELPAGEILHVGPNPAGDDDHPYVWIETDPTGPRQTLTFYGTGMTPDPNARPVASCQCGPFMWHVYKVGL